MRLPRLFVIPLGVILALAVSIATVGLTVEPAWAQDLFGWTDCSWKQLQNPPAAFPVSIGYDPHSGVFPSDSVHDGNTWSFFGRIADSANRWNVEIAGRYASQGTFYIGGGSSEIVVDELDPGSGFFGATSWSTTSGQTCFVHKTPDDPLIGVRIHMKPYSAWFTEDDTQRSYWEQCQSRGYNPSYTCGKNVDFGGAVFHEMGHAFGLAHPENSGPGAATLAKCSDPTDYATMCGHAIDGFPYTAAGRTLQTWDDSSTSEEYRFG